MMKAAAISEARVARYELEIPIEAPPSRVWRAIFDETDAWWLADFHMTGAGSRVTLEPRAGGHLIEHHPEGGSLLWYTVQWIRPADFTVYLAGHVAPDFGGPGTTCLRLQVVERGGASVLRVQDALFGNIDESNLRSLRDGWNTLFTDGLGRHITG